jgi:hypothetical protein
MLIIRLLGAQAVLVFGTSAPQSHNDSERQPFTVGQTVGQPACTVADISDPAHALDAGLDRIPR